MIRPFVFATILAAAFPAFAEDIAVDVGKVATLSTGEAPGTVVVGDPRVADVAVEGGTILVFGKSAGETDLVVFDKRREIILAERILVGGVGSDDSVLVIGPGTAARWNCRTGDRCMREAGR